jgi:cytochrome oxidase Cu insertion factor (SCO1/SenC/PrrC family)
MHPSSADVLGHQLASALAHQLLWTLAAAFVVALVVAGLSFRWADVVTHGGSRLLGGRISNPEPRGRRFLRIGFALLWLVCGALQAQSGMPSGFVSNVVQPDPSSQPAWLSDLTAPFVRAWTRHPVTSDAITVWIQVGLGILLLVAVRGALAKLTCVATIAWSVVVWVIGEQAGGMFNSGATFTTGAPGAVLLYGIAGGLLLLPWGWWSSGRAQLLALRIGAGWLALGALLQATPWERAWTSSGAAGPFAEGSANSQPEFLRRPIAEVATFAASDSAILNAVIVALLAASAIALWWLVRPAVIVAALGVCAITWWLAQDFGVLGGDGTDPNSALPLALLIAVALPVFQDPDAGAPVAERGPTPAPNRGDPPRGALIGALRAGGVAALVAIGAATTVALPAGLAAALPRPADADAVRADSRGGILPVPDRPAPSFDFVDQRGNRTSLAGLRGKIVVLTFLDAVCSTDCPLIANQLAVADRRLGALGARVEFVAIDSNPLFRFRRDVATFTESHGLADLPNWHFVTGDPDAVGAVLGRYGITVQVPTVGMIEHTDAIYFITGTGREVAYLEDGARAELTGTYADEIYAEVRTLLK